MQLSVIIPVYNEERNLESCVSSVLEALPSDSEIIIVNDGSTDETKTIAQRLARQHSEIRLIEHNGGINRGVSASRNLGLTSASGKYIAFIDGDDICRPTRFVESIRILEERPGIDGVLVKLEVFFDRDEDRVIWGKQQSSFDYKQEVLPDAFADIWLRCGMGFQLSILTFRKSLLARSGVFDERRKMSEDWHLWLRMALSGRFSFSSDKEPQMFYRRHSGNTYVPHSCDSFRDLDVLVDVIRWASRSTWVSDDKSMVLSDALIAKLYHCLQMAQDERIVFQGLKAALLGARAEYSLLSSRKYWANIYRLFFPNRLLV